MVSIVQVWGMSPHQLPFINRERKSDNALSLICVCMIFSLFISIFLSFSLLNISRPSLTCTCTQAGAKKREDVMYFHRFYLATVVFQCECIDCRTLCREIMDLEPSSAVLVPKSRPRTLWP